MSLLSSHLETQTAMEFDKIILFTLSPVAQLFLADCLAIAIKLVSFCVSSNLLCSESSREDSNSNKPQAGVCIASRLQETHKKCK